MAAKNRALWRCQTCGAGAPRWVGRCPECGEFGTYVEEAVGAGGAGRPSGGSASAATPTKLSDVTAQETHRRCTGVDEFDRVLGGGLVAGSLVLLGGEPGIGKSTLLLQVADSLGGAGADVLYVTGEESAQQVGLRARRLGATSDGVSLLSEMNVAVVEATVRASSPSVLVLDSIQTAFDPELESAPGTVGQVRACAARMMRIAKELGVTTILVGHVTKDGSIAGPRVLEHLVDTVLYFEGDRDHAFRIIRAVKNRFGSASEIGIFEMGESGLVGVDSASTLLLSERRGGVAGSAVFAAMEGQRPLLVELQALVTPSYLPAPRRLTTGVDAARLLQVLAVLERRAGLSFAGMDVLVSVAGGLRVAEPAVDLPLALALASALRDSSLPGDLAAFGELGLTGHVRRVPHAQARVREATRLGLTRVAAAPGATDAQGVLEVADVRSALELLT